MSDNPSPVDPGVEPFAAGPLPMGIGVMRSQPQRYRDWVAAGGTPPVYGPSPVPPSNTVVPAVTGTAAVGQVLTCTMGTWYGTPDFYAYQWKRDGVNIGTNANTYTTVAGDSGHAVGCVVTATNMWGSGVAPLSNTRAIP